MSIGQTSISSLELNGKQRQSLSRSSGELQRRANLRAKRRAKKKPLRGKWLKIWCEQNFATPSNDKGKASKQDTCKNLGAGDKPPERESRLAQLELEATQVGHQIQTWRYSRSICLIICINFGIALGAKRIFYTPRQTTEEFKIQVRRNFFAEILA